MLLSEPCDEGIQAVFKILFSILEIADTHTTDDQVLKREYHWMNVLDTKQHGYNHSSKHDEN